MHFTAKAERTQSSAEFLAKLSDPGGSVVKVFEVRAWKYSALGGLEMHFTAKTERTQSSAGFLAKLSDPGGSVVKVFEVRAWKYSAPVHLHPIHPYASLIANSQLNTSNGG